MPRTHATALTFYPAYCFPASPTYNAYVKLTAAGVHALQEHRGFKGQNIYFHLNHPIQWVQVAGIVVNIDHLPTVWRFHVDDGSGAILEAVMPREQFPDPPKAGPDDMIRLADGSQVGTSELGSKIDFSILQLGRLIKVKGGLKTFRDEMQISLERLVVMSDTAAEALFWSELTSLYRSVLRRPWELSLEQQQSLKNQELQLSTNVRLQGSKEDENEAKRREMRRKINTRTAVADGQKT